jgi:transglutaminase-like putative cysteine protease
MSAPAGFVGASLLLWGWSIGQLGLGVALALACEVSRAAGLAPRLAARTEQVARVCAGAILLLLVYVLATQSPPQSLYTWLRWLPLLALPMAVAAQYRGHDVTHGYAAIALAAAGTGNGAAPWLYPGYAVLVSWALLARAPRGRIAAAAVMTVAAAAFGHAIHTGIWLLQGEVEELSTELFLELFSGKADPFRERTRIGDMGRIKLSDRIAMRVEVEAPRPGSILLRESAFEHYRNGEWRSARPSPRSISRDGERWMLSGEPATRRLTVRRSYPDGEGLLALPPGTRSLEALAADQLEVFPSGAARVRGAPRFVAFTAAYDPEGERGAPNPGLDLDVPANLAAMLEQVIAANGLRQPTPAASVEAVAAFFGRHFAYSLDLGERRRTLADFLLAERKGHCEYFASATVLLLRVLGVPARYAAGYSAQEYSPLERAFIVRNRHAHAWATAWVDGRWIEVDTTPGSWAQFEAEESRSLLGPVLDFFSWLAERAVRWWLEPSGGPRAWWSAVLIFSAAALAGLGWVRRRRAGTREARPDRVARAWARVESRLARTEHARTGGETVREWVDRLRREGPDESWRERLAGLARWYYAVRFDPAVDEAARREFIVAASRWRPP